LARKLAEENTRHAVLAAYTGALKGSEDSRRSAFNAALRLSNEPSRHFRRRRPPPGRPNNLLCGLVPTRVKYGPFPVIGDGGAVAAATGIAGAGAVETGTENPDASRSVTHAREDMPLSAGHIIHNWILSALPLADFEHLRPHLEQLPLRQRQVLHEPGAAIEDVHFIEEGLASVRRQCQTVTRSRSEWPAGRE
jgi:hypothetical protein